MKGFPFPMKKHEAVFGWMYLFIHAALLLPALRWIAEHTFSGITETGLDVIYYAIGVVLIFAVMFGYMRESFHDLCGSWREAFSSVLLGYLVYYIAASLVQRLLGFAAKDIVAGNSASISIGGKLNTDATLIVGVFLAPIVEEVLFRGTVFGTLRKKNRAIAYTVSAFLFAFYHLWRLFFYSYHWTLFLYMIQFIPAGIVLARCYEKSRSIWGPILLHMLINLMTVTITFGY